MRSDRPPGGIVSEGPREGEEGSRPRSGVRRPAGSLSDAETSVNRGSPLRLGLCAWLADGEPTEVESCMDEPEGARRPEQREARRLREKLESKRGKGF
jgi:hypothetical protein